MKVTSLAALLAVSFAAAGCESMNPPPPSAPPAGPTQPATVSASEPGVIPVGQQIDVRLQERLSSETATPEQRFETTTVVDLVQDDQVLVPAGSVVRGMVTSAEPAGKIDRSGRLTLSFDRLSIGGRTYQIRALPTQAFESGGIREEGGTVGAAGVAGAIVGGILGGVRGAIIGAAVGAGGVIAATEGQDVVLPVGSIIRLRLDQPVRIAASSGR